MVNVTLDQPYFSTTNDGPQALRVEPQFGAKFLRCPLEFPCPQEHLTQLDVQAGTARSSGQGVPKTNYCKGPIAACRVTLGQQLLGREDPGATLCKLITSSFPSRS